MRDEKYIVAVHSALLSFQMIEEALKIFVGLSYEIIQASTPQPLIFKFDKKTITEAPLSRIIKMYDNLSSNSELVSDLKKIIEWRNFCAHNAFRHELNLRSGTTQFSDHSIEDIHKIVEYSVILVQRLADEIRSIQDIHKTIVNACNKTTNI